MFEVIYSTSGSLDESCGCIHGCVRVMAVILLGNNNNMYMYASLADIITVDITQHKEQMKCRHHYPILIDGYMGK